MIGDNLKRFRERRSFSLRKLSAALAEQGVPINADGLNRIEKGRRK